MTTVMGPRNAEDFETWLKDIAGEPLAEGDASTTLYSALPLKENTLWDRGSDKYRTKLEKDDAKMVGKVVEMHPLSMDDDKSYDTTVPMVVLRECFGQEYLGMTFPAKPHDAYAQLALRRKNNGMRIGLAVYQEYADQSFGGDVEAKMQVTRPFIVHKVKKSKERHYIFFDDRFWANQLNRIMQPAGDGAAGVKVTSDAIEASPLPYLDDNAVWLPSVFVYKEEEEVEVEMEPQTLPMDDDDGMDIEGKGSSDEDDFSLSSDDNGGDAATTTPASKKDPVVDAATVPNPPTSEPTPKPPKKAKKSKKKKTEPFDPSVVDSKAAPKDMAGDKDDARPRMNDESKKVFVDGVKRDYQTVPSTPDGQVDDLMNETAATKDNMKRKAVHAADLVTKEMDAKKTKPSKKRKHDAVSEATTDDADDKADSAPKRLKNGDGTKTEKSKTKKKKTTTKKAQKKAEEEGEGEKKEKEKADKEEKKPAKEVRKKKVDPENERRKALGMGYKPGNKDVVEKNDDNKRQTQWPESYRRYWLRTKYAALWQLFQETEERAEDPLKTLLRRLVWDCISANKEGKTRKQINKAINKAKGAIRDDFRVLFSQLSFLDHDRKMFDAFWPKGHALNGDFGYAPFKKQLVLGSYFMEDDERESLKRLVKRPPVAGKKAKGAKTSAISLQNNDVNDEELLKDPPKLGMEVDSTPGKTDSDAETESGDHDDSGDDSE